MDTTKTFTKIILAAIGMYFLIMFIPHIISMAISIFASSESDPLWFMLILFFSYGSLLVLLWYLFIYRREHLVNKIAANSKSEQGDNQTEWFPAALRLICVLAGLYCLFNASFLLMSTINMYLINPNIRPSSLFSTFGIIRIAVVLVVSIYLLCGAPHFVRWHVKKTRQLYGKSENSIVQD